MVGHVVDCVKRQSLGRAMWKWETRSFLLSSNDIYTTAPRHWKRTLDVCFVVETFQQTIKKSKRIPRGTSEYQAAWILDDEDWSGVEEEESGVEDEGMEEELEPREEEMSQVGRDGMMS